MSPMTNSSARKRHENTTPKEDPMVTIATPPQVADDLHAIRTEATTATSVLAEIRDLLDERLPSLDNSEHSLSAAASTERFTEPDDSDAFYWMRQAEKAEAELGELRAAREHIADWRADEVERLRRGIWGGLNESRSMQADVRSSVTLAYLQSVLDELLEGDQS